MSPEKKQIKNKPKKYLLELTLKTLIVWGLGSFLLLAWIFILGVLVGSGNLTFGIVKDKFDEIHEKVGGEDPSKSDLITKSEEDPKLEFYEELSSKKEDAAKNIPPTPQKQAVPTGIRDKHEETPDKMMPPQKEMGQYVLQIGFFGDKAKAVSLVNRLSDLGFPAYFSNANVDGRLYYRVKCGPFETEKKADEFKITLAKKEGIYGFVTRAEKNHYPGD
jgi:cell division protein FtsN